jgi:hypothetical protein
MTLVQTFILFRVLQFFGFFFSIFLCFHHQLSRTYFFFFFFLPKVKGGEFTFLFKNKDNKNRKTFFFRSSYNHMHFYALSQLLAHKSRQNLGHLSLGTRFFLLKARGSCNLTFFFFFFFFYPASVLIIFLIFFYHQRISFKW